MNAALFSTVVLAWGVTWYAIRLELGDVPTDVSIFWRFALAAALMWLGLAATGRLKPVPWRQHRWLAVMGLCLFSCNFMLFYTAEASVPSGIVSVVFSMATVFNAFNQWLFHRAIPQPRVLAGAALGVAGVGLLFADQLTGGATTGAGYGLGGLLSLVGTYTFSLGNLISRKVTGGGGIDLPNAMARAMLWGCAVLATIVLTRGHGFMPGTTLPYLAGLVYLAAVGSVVGFLAYLSLVGRIGPEKAAYCTVLSPVIALTVSTVLESYQWTLAAAAGLPLVLLGNLVIFAPAWIWRRLVAVGASS